MKEIEEPRIFLLSTSWSLVSVKFKTHTSFLVRLLSSLHRHSLFSYQFFSVWNNPSIEYTSVRASQSDSSPFIIPCFDGAIFAVINCCWSDHEVNLVNVWMSVVLIRLCAWRSLKRLMRVERCIGMLIEWHFDVMLVSWSQTNIQRLEFIVVNLIYVLYSMVLRTSGHELHVQLCSTFRVLSVSCCCVLTCMYACIWGWVLLVHRTRDHTVIFTQHGSAYSLFSLKLLYSTISAASCCPCSSSFLRLKVIGEVPRIDICSVIELQVCRSVRNIDA